MAAKYEEFNLWMVEVKQVDPESLAKWEERDAWLTFMEDFNTGTLPHRKYYDLEAYRRR